MKQYNLILFMIFASTLSSFGQCQNCFEGPSTVFTGQTAYYYWGGIPGGVWYITNVSPHGMIGTPTQTSDILSIPITGPGTFSVTHDNANGTQVNVVAWAIPGPPDSPYVESTQCGQVTISMWTQNKPSDVDWYWVDAQGNFVSISSSINVYSNSAYYLQSRSHDHPEIIGGLSQAIDVTMPARPVDGVIQANGSSAPITVCAGESFTIRSFGGVGLPHYWASSNGMTSWNIFNDQHAGESSFTFKTWVGGTYTFGVRNRTDLCGFCWDAGNTCLTGSTVNVVVIPPADAGELFLNNVNGNVCVGTRIPVRLINNAGTAYYNVSYKKDTDNDGDLDIVNVEDAANLGASFEYTLNDDGEWTFEYWSQACSQNSSHRISTISVWAAPSAPQFGPDRLVCSGEGTNIHVTPGYPATGVRWYDGLTAIVPLNSYPYTADFLTGPLNQSKEYWVASYRAFSTTTGCEGARYPYFVSVTPRPVDSEITASAASICLGETVHISTSGGVGTKHFYCSSNGGSSWNIFNDGYIGVSQFDHTPGAAGTYRYRVRNNTACGYCGDPGNNCSGEKYVIVVVSPRPVVSSIAGQKNVLFGQPYKYSVTATPPGAMDFNWKVTDGTIVSGQGTGNVIVKFARVGGEISVTASRGQCASITIPSLTVGEGGNYVIEETMLIADIVDPTAVPAMNENTKSKTTTFYDGLGRQIQSVGWRASPGRNDIVMPNVYDVFGREPVKYLPFTGGNDGYYKADPVGNVEIPYTDSPQHDFYDGRIPTVAVDDTPNVKTVFELSPLNKVLKQGFAGTVWQPGNPGQDDHAIEKHYLFNAANEVYQFLYNATTGLVSLSPADRFYDANELLATKTIDEENHEVIEYLDKHQRVICKKVQHKTDAAGIKYASTYYVYDDSGMLVAVLPPEAVK